MSGWHVTVCGIVIDVEEKITGLGMPRALPVPPLSCADVGISEFVSGDVPGIGGRVKCYPEDFQVNEIRLRDGTVCAGSFDMAACDKHGRLLLGTDHWPVEGEREDGVEDPLPARCIGKHEESFRFTMCKRQADTLEALAELSSVLRISQRTFSFAGIKDSWAVTAQEVCARLADITPKDIASAVYEHIPWMRVEQFRMIPVTEGTMGWLAPGRLRGNRFAIVIRDASPPGAGSGDVDRAIRKAVKAAEEHGFVNYVGLQRFAKGGIRSDLVGLAYLRRDYAACVEGMLNGVARHPSECAEGTFSAINPPRAHWIDVWKRTNSPSATLRAGLPGSAWAEKRVLVGMDAALRRKRDWAAACRDAFLSLPKTIRTLYVHAYLDRLWNLTVSERIQRGGARCVAAGDIVVLDSATLCDEGEELECAWDASQGGATSEGDKDEVDGVEDEGKGLHDSAHSKATTDDCQMTNGDTGRMHADGTQAMRSAIAGMRPQQVHVVTEQEAKEAKFSIFDVVVPRAGAGLNPEELATPAGKMLERYLWYDELDVLGLEVELCQQTSEEEVLSLPLRATS